MLGPKVNDTLSQVVNSGIRATIDRGVAKELCSKYNRPENCEALIVPKLNKELWNAPTLMKTTKEVDKSFQLSQRYLNQGLIPLVSLMDQLLKTDNSEQFKLARDSFQLLAYAHRDLSNIRRQQIKGVVDYKYKQLCNDTTPVTENLLGDELEKQIKTMDEMRKVGKELSKYKGEKTRLKSTNTTNSNFKRYDRYNRQGKHTSGYQTQDNSFLFKKSRLHQSYQSAHKKQQFQKKRDNQKQ